MTKEEKQQTYLTALAGLLHDIGKFGQRAGETSEGKKNHPAVGDRFVIQHVLQRWRGALAPVGWHHGDPEHPGRLDGLGLPVKIVALADRLSSGEREQLDQDSSRPKQLISIFSRLNLDGQEGDIAPSYLPLKPLTLARQNIFPEHEALSDDRIKQEYRSLWDSFCTDADTLAAAHAGENADIESYLESMFHLLRRYTWSIPSAFYQAQTDISLYEHLHTTAALSACFTQEWSGPSGEQQVDRLLDSICNQAPPGEPPVAGLLVGDLSGIQGFLYSLHNAKRATSVLRARSFYVQMLVEASARYLLRRLELPITNALYIGGGGFSLIVPPLTESKVEDLARSINRVLADAYHGEVYLALGHTPLAPSDFSIGSFSAVQTRTAEVLEEKKNHRFSELSSDEIRNLFSPHGIGGQEEGICSICGNEAQDLEVEEDDPDIRWCASCRSFRELGEDLRRAKYLLLADVEPDLAADSAGWTNVLRALGTYVAVGESPPTVPSTALRSVLFALGDEQGGKPNPRLAVGHKFLVNLAPQRQQGESLPDEFAGEVRTGAIKHFGVLAHQSAGVPYLGILRMDMDNLGKIFSRGLRPYSSLSRQATLSLLLSVFFEGWVGEIASGIAADDGAKRERLYSIYSGGDDLFFVGAWDATVKLARRVRRELASYTGRSDLGISGGIVLVHEKTPLYLAASHGGMAESAAKHIREKKDGVSFLGTSLPWEKFGTDDEERTVSHWASTLQEMIETGTVNRSLLHIIQDVHAQYKRGREARGEMGPWVWRAAYWFARAQERNKRNEGFVNRIEELKKLLSGKNFAKNIEWLALAARWAELATRGKGSHV